MPAEFTLKVPLRPKKRIPWKRQRLPTYKSPVKRKENDRNLPNLHLLEVHVNPTFPRGHRQPASTQERSQDRVQGHQLVAIAREHLVKPMNPRRGELDGDASFAHQFSQNSSVQCIKSLHDVKHMHQTGENRPRGSPRSQRQNSKWSL